MAVYGWNGKGSTVMFQALQHATYKSIEYEESVDEFVKRTREKLMMTKDGGFWRGNIPQLLLDLLW